MSKKDEALKLALEFIEQVDYPPYDDKPVITAIREALAEQPAQQQEPQPPYEFDRYVAGSLRAQGVRVERATTLADAMRIASKICPPANPQSAPTVLVYTSPPAPKPWVGLTDEDHAEVKDVMLHVGVGAGVAWIENKLREKNA